MALHLQNLKKESMGNVFNQVDHSASCFIQLGQGTVRIRDHGHIAQSNLVNPNNERMIKSKDSFFYSIPRVVRSRQLSKGKNYFNPIEKNKNEDKTKDENETISKTRE